MTSIHSLNLNRSARLVARLLAGLALTTVSTLSHAAEPDQSRLAPPPGDGWQMLSAPNARPASTQVAVATPHAALASPSTKATTSPAPAASLDVAPVVVPAGTATVPGGVLSLSITPQDINLRNALDRWLQQQGWQLAWKIDDDLPLEFNATFSGDFKSVLTQVMQATNHMRTPTRVCKHTNNVIRVVARAANCQE
ncbi:TcpQ domain-containing protein [Caballeronia sp. LZ043]|uniref:toxin co-regulated pilus biosynthesis Q family protein n=1 Tax=Caballeronia sp. LZ043 TaxID=3038569 RepID=UPI00285567ED|nr:TcpQ domain-containing protein [Caballeronia sp. LZ043]MDR5826004.1 TcpQ domain-containing protein [Caballeronia sp. LZ043]